MGSACVADPEKKNSDSVDSTLKRQNQNELKVLLLGAGESGKSTIFKQMKINYLNDFTKEESVVFRDVVYGNTMRSMRTLIQASLTLQTEIENSDNKERAQKILEFDQDKIMSIGNFWEPKLGEYIKELWMDPGIQKTFEKRNQFQLDDSAPYFFKEIDRINEETYVPTTQDILRCRVKTTGIVEMSFELSKKTVKVIDVGGQRNERKKWIHCFEGVTAIIFVVSLSEYDQNCYEDDKTNRMQESLLLFEEISNSRYFTDTPVILFLNKIDLFKEKIEVNPLSNYFSDYKGPNTFEATSSFLRDKFISLCKANEKGEKKQIYPHTTCGTDSDQLKKVFHSIQDILLNKALGELGIL